MGDLFATEADQDKTTKKIEQIMRTQAAPGSATDQQLHAVAEGVKEALKEVYEQELAQKFATAGAEVCNCSIRSS